MKIIRGSTVLIAVFFWVATILNAPWSVQTDRFSFSTEFRPVWEIPSSVVSPARLRLEILLVEWLAIGGAAAAGIYITRTKT